MLIAASNLSSLQRRWAKLALAAVGILPGILPMVAGELALGGMAQAAPIGVVGTDDRTTPSYSWMQHQRRKGIGQLEIQQANGKYYTCTFTVVGENLGLTNTHCLLDDKGRKPLQIKAYALRHGNRYANAANVDMYWTGLDKAPQTVGDFSKDWAVLRFDRKLGKKTGTFGNGDWSTDVKQSGQSVVGIKVYAIGYSGDWPTAAKAQLGNIPGFTPSRHTGCTFLGVDAGLIMHDCDGTPGSSGTGLHSRSRKLQGLDAAAYYDPKTKETLFNLAVPLERFMPAVATLRKSKGNAITVVPRV
jgi:Trypsin-like peptidase domain